MPLPLNTVTLNVPAKLTKQDRFKELLAANRWTAIHTAEWDLLRETFAEPSLRKWLEEAGIPVDQPYRGVETKTFDALESSLTAMTDRYLQETNFRKSCRETVIQAKDRIRFASRNPKVDSAKRAVKSEMVDWMLVWLDDPAMFPGWCAIRKQATPLSGLHRL